MSVTCFQSQDALWEKAVECIRSIYDQKQRPLIVGASGGSSSQIFPKLLQGGVNLDKWQIFLVDERYVSYEHAHSNYRLLRERLGDTGAQLYSFDTSLPKDEALADYQARLPEFFDIIIYGMGPDGHTASLFPDTDILESTQMVGCNQTEIFDVYERLTLTYEALKRSEQHLVLATGESKKPVIQALQSGDVDYHEYPIAKILDWEGSMLLYAP